MRDCLRFAAEGIFTPTQCDKILSLGLELGACVQLAKEYGVPMASGSDYITRRQHGRNLEEIALMREAGLTPAEALLAATSGGAELCGVADTYGRIAPGFAFDAIVLDEDPGDLSRFHEPGVVTGVFKGGEAAVLHPRFAQTGTGVPVV
jgi:imidazolonepropionase-like amidohydrolase